MMVNMTELRFVSRICSCVLIGFVSLLFMWKLITLHVGFGAAFLASLILYLLCSILTFKFEKSLFWDNYLKEVQRELHEIEEYHQFLDNYWKQYLLKE